SAAATVGTSDSCAFVSVNLLSGEQRPIAGSDCVPNSAMRRIQPRHYFWFIVRNVDARYSLRKSVTTDSDRAQRRKLFEGKVHHLNSKSRDAHNMARAKR